MAKNKSKFNTFIKGAGLTLLGAFTLSSCAERSSNNSSQNPTLSDPSSYIQELEEELQKALEENQELKAENNQLKEDKISNDVTITSLQKSIMILTTEIDNLQSQIDNNEISIDQANKLIDRYNENIQELQNKLSISEYDNQELSSYVEELNAKITELNNKLQTVNSDYNDLSSENSELKLSYIDLQEKYNELNNKYKELVSEKLNGDNIEKVVEDINALSAKVQNNTTFTPEMRASNFTECEALTDRVEMLYEYQVATSETYLSAIALINGIKEVDCYNNVKDGLEELTSNDAIAAKGTAYMKDNYGENTLTAVQCADADSIVAVSENGMYQVCNPDGTYEYADNEKYELDNINQQPVGKDTIVDSWLNELNRAFSLNTCVVEYSSELDEYTVSYSEPEYNSESTITHGLSMDEKGNNIVSSYAYTLSYPSWFSSSDISIIPMTQAEYDNYYNSAKVKIQELKELHTSDTLEK